MNKTFSTNLFEGLPIFRLFYVVFVISRILWCLFFSFRFFSIWLFLFLFLFWFLLSNFYSVAYVHSLAGVKKLQPKEEKSWSYCLYIFPSSTFNLFINQ